MAGSYAAGAKPVPSLNGTLVGTDEQLLVGPPASEQTVRCVSFANVYNTYTASITLTLKLRTKTGATVILGQFSLAVAESWRLGELGEEILLDDDTSLVATLGAEAEKADFVATAWDVPL